MYTGSNYGYNNVNKKNICRYYAANGDCFYGNECTFVHQPNCNNNTRSRAISSNDTSDTNYSQLPAESKLQTYLSSFYNNEMTPQLSALSLESLNRRKITGNNNTINSNASSQGVQSSILNCPQLGNGHPYSLNSNTPSTSSTGSSMTSNQSHHQRLPTPPPSYFISDDIKMELLRKQNILYGTPNSEIYGDLPSQVDDYHELVPLDNMLASSSSFGFVDSVYRATNIKTGYVYCLRRIHSFQPNTTNTKSLINAIDSWKKLEHCNIVRLRQVFTTKVFSDNSLIFVYDYYPGAQTLMNQYFTSHCSGMGPNGARPYSQQSRTKLLPESLIWTIIIQLSSALRTIHANGLACRAFDPNKIILTSGILPENANPATYNHNPRVRLSCCGVLDVLAHDTFLQELQQCNAKALISHFQQEDLLAFGKVCLALSCNSLTAAKAENWVQSLEAMSRTYSPDLRSLIFFLLSSKSPNGPRTINDIMPMIGGRFFSQLDLSYQRCDVLENQLSKELHNGRLFRLLSKLGSINERPELRMDPQWSETGDRYLLKLFRDYLFHQVNEDGHPWLDIGHIVSTLNKLDAGSMEKICLVSRDDQNVLIVSFSELKKCFDSAFNELLL